VDPKGPSDVLVSQLSARTMQKLWGETPPPAESISAVPVFRGAANEACETDPLVKAVRSTTNITISETQDDPVTVCGWLEMLRANFGCKMLVLLFVVQHLLKGFGNNLTSRVSPYLYRDYNVPAPRMQIYLGVTLLPWAMKPMLGLLSDVLPIFGYNKAPYMLITSALSALGYVVLWSYPELELPIVGAVACIFLTAVQVSTADLLSEAKYAEKIQTRPKSGPDLLTFVWFGVEMGGLVAVLLSGVLINHIGVRGVYLVCLIPSVSVLFPVATGCLEEPCLSAEEIADVRERFFKQREACALCVIMCVGITLLTICGIAFHSAQVNCAMSLVVGMVVLFCFSIVLSPVIAKFNAFALLQTALSFSTSGAAFYFFTDDKDQYPKKGNDPGGPHFDKFFYNSVMGTVGAVFSLAGVYTYNRYMKSWTYRSLLVFTNVVAAVISLSDVVIFTRINRHLNIPDKVFVLCSSAVAEVIDSWRWMPQVVILSYLCPKGMEATMYALLAGCHNLGNTIANNSGALLLEILNCRPSGRPNENEEFEYLWVASAISIVLPLLTVLLLFKLIPDAHQDERILIEEQTDATAGSLWKRWTSSGTNL